MKKLTQPDSFVLTKKFILPVTLIGMLLLNACEQPTEQQEKAEYIKQSVLEPAPEAQVQETTTTPPEEPVFYPASHPIAKSVNIKNDENITKTAWTVREQFIDSLNKVVPVYDKTKYNNLSVTYFTSLAHDLHGRTFFANNADSLRGSIMDILSSRLMTGLILFS